MQLTNSKQILHIFTGETENKHVADGFYATYADAKIRILVGLIMVVAQKVIVSYIPRPAWFAPLRSLEWPSAEFTSLLTFNLQIWAAITHSSAHAP